MLAIPDNKPVLEGFSLKGMVALVTGELIQACLIRTADIDLVLETDEQSQHVRWEPRYRS